MSSVTDIHLQNVADLGEDELINAQERMMTDAGRTAYEHDGGAAVLHCTLNVWLQTIRGRALTLARMESNCLRLLDWVDEKREELRHTPIDLTHSDDEATHDDSDKDDSPPSSPEHYLTRPRWSPGVRVVPETPVEYDDDDDDELVTPARNTDRKRKKNALCLAPSACRTRTADDLDTDTNTDSENDY